MQSDRQLLLGMLALQCGFVTKGQLVAAISDWTKNRSLSLDAILVQKQLISNSQRTLLCALVEEHLQQHSNDLAKSLASVGSASSIRSDLSEIDDPELNASLLHVPSDLSTHAVGSTNSYVTMAIATGQRSSRFRVLRAHAEGGLGRVSVALDEELRREVAFKEIKAQFADHLELRQRFVREAEITGALEHPSIVPIYGLGAHEDGRPYYAMRFIKGDSLKNWISDFHSKKLQMSPGERSLALRNLLSRFVDVCQAMHYAHSRGVLHRDLKPHNVMLGKYGETLIVDWGLAKASGDSVEGTTAPDTSALVSPKLSDSADMTLQGSHIGTPTYMSPEQAEGKLEQLGPASDIYSLGVTLYHCLAGKPPFTQENKSEVLEAVRRGEFPKPREVDKSISKTLEAICLKAMQREPGQRYRSAQSLAEDIEKYLADEPVSAFAETLRARARRWIKRHPAIASTTVACTVLGLIGALGLAYVRGAYSKSLELQAQELRTKDKTISAQNSDLKQKNDELTSERKKALDSLALATEATEKLKANNTALDLAKGQAESAKKKAKELSDSNAEMLEQIRGDKDRMVAASVAALDELRLLGLRSSSSSEFQKYRQLSELILNPTLTQLEDSYHQMSQDLAAMSDWDILQQQVSQVGDLAIQLENSGFVERLAPMSLKILQDLVARDPLYTPFKVRLADQHTKYGRFIYDTTGKVDPALAHLRDAEEILASLEIASRDVSVWTSLAKTFATRADILGDSSGDRDPAAALAEYKKALDQLDEVGGVSNSAVQFEKARIHCERGYWFSKVGSFDEARAEYNRSQELGEKILNENTTDFQPIKLLARVHQGLGDVLNQMRQPSEAANYFRAAIANREVLAKVEPSAETRFLVAKAQFDLGNSQLMAKSYNEAKEVLAEARKTQFELHSAEPLNAKYLLALRRTLDRQVEAAKVAGDGELELEAKQQLDSLKSNLRAPSRE